MKRIFATLIGAGLTAGLAWAAPTNTPQDLIARYLATNDAADITANWQDWHPDAVHSITVKYGQGQPDDTISYAMADYETLPDWQLNPAFAEVMENYAETTSSEPQVIEEITDEGTVITTKSTVNYIWDGYAGNMLKSERFLITPRLGALAIRSLSTTYDYR